MLFTDLGEQEYLLIEKLCKSVLCVYLDGSNYPCWDMLKNKKIPVVNISRCHSSTFESRQSLLNFKQSYVGEQRSFPPEHCEQSSYGPIT